MIGNIATALPSPPSQAGQGNPWHMMATLTTTSQRKTTTAAVGSVTLGTMGTIAELSTMG
jgi:hypothetical protein